MQRENVLSLHSSNLKVIAITMSSLTISPISDLRSVQLKAAAA